ncbi:high mobility group protein [Anaeramoeba flamelloides]|uniref:High mobility group protein n=1 Tax=Anaeramoeba flamelloides TaxID=1746091 RepID=A0AAV7YUA1_9EUKA|nr:high mobility group protein [Anaeramoeba flamelloides]
MSRIKRPRSAFVYYMLKMRPKLEKENPQISFKKVCKLIGESWNHLSEEDKKPFQKQADDDKLRYQREIKQLNSENNTEEIEEKDDLLKELNKKWKELPSEEQEKYQLLSLKDKERLKRELDNFHQSSSDDGTDSD